MESFESIRSCARIVKKSRTQWDLNPQSPDQQANTLTTQTVMLQPMLSKQDHIWAAVVAQQYSVRLITERSWVQIPPGAGLFFSSLYPLSGASLILVPQWGATLFIFQLINQLSCEAWAEASWICRDWAKKRSHLYNDSLPSILFHQVFPPFFLSPPVVVDDESELMRQTDKYF